MWLSLVMAPTVCLLLYPGMSDFQYLAVHTEAGGRHTSMYDKVVMLKPEKEEFFNQELPLYIPPPTFSRLDNPVDYYYRPETQHRYGPPTAHCCVGVQSKGAGVGGPESEA